jgi:hypothetical protein
MGLRYAHRKVYIVAASEICGAVGNHATRIQEVMDHCRTRHRCLEPNISREFRHFVRCSDRLVSSSVSCSCVLVFVVAWSSHYCVE